MESIFCDWFDCTVFCLCFGLQSTVTIFIWCVLFSCLHLQHSLRQTNKAIRFRKSLENILSCMCGVNADGSQIKVLRCYSSGSKNTNLFQSDCNWLNQDGGEWLYGGIIMPKEFSPNLCDLLQLKNDPALNCQSACFNIIEDRFQRTCAERQRTNKRNR